jgi:hypothetical protein
MYCFIRFAINWGKDVIFLRTMGALVGLFDQEAVLFLENIGIQRMAKSSTEIN